MAPSSRGEGWELPGGSAGRRFCRHGHEVYDGFTAYGSVVTWGRVLKALRDTQWQRFGPRLRRTAVLYCLRELLFLFILCVKSHLFFVSNAELVCSGTGNDPEVARARLVGWLRRPFQGLLLRWKVASRSPDSIWTPSH